MARTVFSDDARWSSLAKYIHRTLIIGLLMLLLTASLAALAYRTSALLVLSLAQWVAIIGAVLQAAVVVMLTGLIVRATGLWRRLRAEGKCTVESKQLCGVILRVMGNTVWMLLLTIMAACIPVLLQVVMQVPEGGFLFILIIAVWLVQGARTNHICRRLVAAIADAQQAAQRTLVI